MMDENRSKFICANCGAEGINAWSDAAMMEEFFRLHPGADPKKMIVICDECHQIELSLKLVKKGSLQ